MAKLQIYSAKGVRKGTTEFPKRFVERQNLKLLAQAIRVYEDRIHPGTHKVKTRGEVNASTIKIYRQKGTGRARHGAISAPIFVGGGVAHGPKGIKRVLSLPRKMRQKALRIALSMKVSGGQVVFADNLESLEKTKDANKLLNLISEKEFKDNPPKNIVVALSKTNLPAKQAFRNIKNVLVFPFEELNARIVFFADLLVIDKDALTEGGKALENAPTKVQKHNVKSTKSKKEKTSKPKKSVKRKVRK